MQGIMSSQKERNILITIIVACVIIIIIGLYMAFVKNPKYMMMYVIQDLDNTFLTDARQELSFLNFISSDFTLDGDLYYYLTQAGIKEETVTKKVNKETITEIIQTPCQDVFSNNIKLHLNKNSKNVQDIIKLTFPEKEKLYNVYYKNGALTLDVPEYDQYVRLNDDIIKTGNISIKVIDNSIIMYERFRDTLLKQFQTNDFYYFKENSTYEIGLTLTTGRFKEYISNAVEALMKDKEFVNAYILYNKEMDINSNFDGLDARDKLIELKNKIDNYEIDENILIELLLTTDDIINKDISNIQIMISKNSTITNLLKIDFESASINVKYQDNNNSSITVLKNDTEFGYTLILNDESKNNFVTIEANKFAQNRKISIKGNLNGDIITGFAEYTYVSDNKGELKFNVSVDRSDIHIFEIKLNSIIEIGSFDEYVASKKIYTKEQLDYKILEYVTEFENTFKAEKVI